LCASGEHFLGNESDAIVSHSKPSAIFVRIVSNHQAFGDFDTAINNRSSKLRETLDLGFRINHALIE